MCSHKAGLGICLISSPEQEYDNLTGKVFIPNFIGLLQSCCNQIYIIGDMNLIAEKVKVLTIGAPRMRGSLLWKGLRNIFIQLKVCSRLLRIARKVDLVIFYVNDASVLPTLLAKLLRKKVSFVATGLVSESSKTSDPNKIRRYVIYKIHRMFENIVFKLVDQIAVESPCIAHSLGLSQFGGKITINGALYIDTTLFAMKTRLAERRELVGYVGPVTATKGVVNLTAAMPLIVEGNSDISFLVVGRGKLLEYMKEETRKQGLKERVTFAGWIPHNELTQYYGQMKLMVFPSYTEGLPGVVQEAMACGIPVVATPVGGVPDLIKDGETGFIIEDNSPKCIARNVIRALNHPNLDEIAQNACKLIEQEYTYEAMVEKCRVSLNELVKGKK